MGTSNRTDSSRFDKALRILAVLIEVGIAIAIVLVHSSLGVVFVTLYAACFSNALNLLLPKPPCEMVELISLDWLDKPLEIFAIVLELAIVSVFIANRSVVGLAFCSLYIYFSATCMFIENL